MEGSHLIDGRTISRLRMTPEEAAAVTSLWAIQNRLAQPEYWPSNSIPSGLIIPPDEVRSYLAEVRGKTSRRFRPARSLGADVRLAFIAASVLVVAAIGFSIMFSFGRSRMAYPRPIARTTVVNDLHKTDYFGFAGRDTLLERSRYNRYAFSRGASLFTASNVEIRPRLDELQKALATVIQGPLALNSRLSPTPLGEDEIRRALTRSANRTYSDAASRRLLEWETIDVAFNGKVTSAEVPFARFSDKALRSAVEQEQQKIIAKLAESAVALTGRPAPSSGTPAPDAPASR